MCTLNFLFIFLLDRGKKFWQLLDFDAKSLGGLCGNHSINSRFRLGFLHLGLGKPHF